MSKKILSLLLAVMLILGTVPMSALAVGEEAAVTDVTEIATVDDLLAFATKVNEGEKFAGKTVRLTADIDLSGKQWEPIGGDSVYFAGEFDGNGKTISNLTNTENVARKGLFGLVEKCYIHDLTLKDVKFSGNATDMRVGALAGNLQYYNVIKNVTVDGLDYDLNDTDGLIGGLAGYTWTSYVKNCVVKNAKMNISSSADSAVGGVIAYGRGVDDARTQFPYADKIAEVDYQGNSVWNYCDSKLEDAEVNLSGTVTFGGFLGADTYNSWRNYAHNNTVTGLKVTCAEDNGVYTVGGFMGGQYGGMYSDALSANTVSGTITSKGTNTASTFGGFIGYVGGRPGGVTACSADVKIDAAAGDVGGFVGETQQYFAHEYKFDSCEAKGDVKTANGTAGGFVSNVQHGGDGSQLNVVISNSTVNGKVNGTTANALIGNVNDNKSGTATGGEVELNNNVVAENVTVNGNAVTDENTIGGKTELVVETICINNLEELKAFRDNVNNGNTYEGKTVLLAADIDLKNEIWTPIGTHENIFKGTFDGQNHTISNLTIKAETSRQGLFGCAGASTIKNLTMHNATVDSLDGSHIAVLVGHGDHSEEVGGHTFDNIKITGLVKLKGVTNMGTIVGTAPNVNIKATNITVDVEEGSIVDSTLNITESAPAGRYYSYTGGVFGQVWGNSFENITSNIDVTGSCSGTGGITGGATGTWKNITHTGDVIIAGKKDMDYWYTNKDENGNAYGLVYWWQGAGKISGYHGGTTFDNCVSTGTLTYQADNTNTNEIYYSANILNPTTEETIETVTLCDSRFGSSRFGNDNTITVKDYAVLDDSGEVVEAPVAMIDEIGYTTLQAAVNAAYPGDVITLIADVVENGIKVPGNMGPSVSADNADGITIDLNGHTLYGDMVNGDYLTVKNGTVKGTRFVSAIESNGENANLVVESLEVISYRHALRIEGGTATIVSGTYQTLGKVDGDSDVHAVNAGGEFDTVVTIKGGTFIGVKGSANTNCADSGSAVQAQANATVTIEDGTFSGGQNNTLNTINEGSLTVTGGKYDQDPTAYAADGYFALESEGWWTVICWKNCTECSAENPHIITTTAELNAIRNHIDTANNNINGYFKLGNDITFTAEDFAEGGKFYRGGQGWLSIGHNDIGGIYGSNNGIYFVGSFDGNKKTISGITTTYTNDTKKFNGLFALVSGKAYIGNVALNDFNLKAEVPGVVAGMVNADGAVIENIVVKNAYVETGHDRNNAAGLLIGRLSGATVKNIYISNSNFKGGSWNCGSIAGQITNSTLENIHVTDSNFSSWTYSGILAQSISGSTKISNINFANCKFNSAHNPFSYIAYKLDASDDAYIKDVYMHFDITGNLGDDSNSLFNTEITGIAMDNVVLDLTFSEVNGTSDIAIINNVVYVTEHTINKAKPATGKMAVAYANGGKIVEGKLVNGELVPEWYDNAELTGEAVTALEAGKTYYAKWVEDNSVAQIGDTKYESLAEAIANANDGATVTLLSDVNVDSLYINNQKFTLDINGHSLTIASGLVNSIMIVDGSDVTITGGGSITGGGMMGLICVGSGSTLTFGENAGSFKANYDNRSIVWIETANDIVDTVKFNGGTFEGTVLQSDIGNSLVTKGENVNIAAPEGYEWANNTTLQIATPFITNDKHSVSFDDIVYINKYVYINNLNTNIYDEEYIKANGGMLIWDTEISEAEANINNVNAINNTGLLKDSKGRYTQRTQGIVPKKFGDKFYIRVYLKLIDGTYVYSDLMSYSVKEWCEAAIENSKYESGKKAAIAMLYYGAAAQVQLKYKTDDLANKDIVDVYPCPIEFVDSLLAPIAEFTTLLQKTDDFKLGKSVSYDEELKINYYYTVSDKEWTVASAELQVWNSNNTTELTADNISYTSVMVDAGNGRWSAQSQGFDPYEYDDTIFVRAKFVDTEGNIYYSDISAYSIEGYVKDAVEKGSETMKDLAEKTVIYGELATAYLTEYKGN